METTTNYMKVASHEAKKGEFSRCLLLYSGGLDTSVMLKWIQEEYNCDVIALTIDLGQTEDDLEAIEKKALNLGAKEAITHDAKDQFADLILSEAIKSNAQYQGGYALSTPLGRVMISKLAVMYAQEYDCDVVAHGCTGKGNDQVRFESYITTLDNSIKIIAPVREWGMGRQEEIAYAEKHGIEVRQKAEKPYSYDENMWGNTGEGGEIEDPEQVPNFENIQLWCNTLENTPDEPEYVEIKFEKGVPIAINDEQYKLSKIINICNSVGAKHGVGVFPVIEDRLVGLKVRGVYENPAATILVEAHQNLEQLVSTIEENEMKKFIDTKWAYLTYAAKWYDPVMYHISAFTNDMNKKVTGTVKVKLFKGNATVVSLQSDYSLFDSNLATFEKNAKFNQNSSAGFIEIYSLAERTAFSVFDYEKSQYEQI